MCDRGCSQHNDRHWSWRWGDFQRRKGHSVEDRRGSDRSPDAGERSV